MSAQLKPMQFKGLTADFFGIWIVNILLTIVTLGIYSAWAKVRTNRFMYSNTYVGNDNFTYLAQPLQILKGRIIAIIFFAIYVYAQSASPQLAVFMMLALIIATPWLINQGLRFAMRMTSFKNVRFKFSGTYFEALLNFILLPILSVFTLYLALPWVLKRMDQYIHENLSYGDRPLTVNLSTGTYYGAAVAAIGATIAMMVVLGIAAVMVGVSLGDVATNPTAGAGASIALIALYVLLGSLVSAMYQAMIRAHVFDNCEFEQVASFKSTVAPLPLAALMITNLLALVCSLGLAYPWVRVRTARFMCDNTQVELHEQLETVIDNNKDNTEAFGEEAGELFDVDVGII